jgi:putative endonuclease
MAGHYVQPKAFVRVERCPEGAKRAGGDHTVYYVYLLLCSDDSFYVGSTQNLPDCVQAHNVGRGSTYTPKRRPVRLMYAEVFKTEAEAIRRERQLKRWCAAKKQSLINGDIETLKRLSKRLS